MEFVVALNMDLKLLVQQDVPKLFLVFYFPFKGFSHLHVTDHPWT